MSRLTMKYKIIMLEAVVRQLNIKRYVEISSNHISGGTIVYFHLFLTPILAATIMLEAVVKQLQSK